MERTLQILITGVSGYVGAALVPRLLRDGHAVRGFARSHERVAGAGVALDDLVLGDATTGEGLDAALAGIDVAYYLIHSMEGPVAGFADNGLIYCTSTAGSVDDAVVAGDLVVGAIGRSAISSGAATVELNYPFVTDALG